MIGRPFQLPGFLVNMAAGTFFAQGLACQYQVYTQSHVAPKSGGPVVPPAKAFFFLLKQAEGILQPQIEYVLQSIALRGTRLRDIG